MSKIQTLQLSDMKEIWVTPKLQELDVSETAHGMGGSDGNGGGSQQSGNSSGGNGS